MFIFHNIKYWGKGNIVVTKLLINIMILQGSFAITTFITIRFNNILLSILESVWLFRLGGSFFLHTLYTCYSYNKFNFKRQRKRHNLNETGCFYLVKYGELSVLCC